MKKENITWNQLVRYLGDESSPGEEHDVTQWIQAAPEHKAFAEHLRRVWDQPLEKKQDWEIEAAWQRFQMDYYDESFGDGDRSSSMRLVSQVPKEHKESSASTNQVRYPKKNNLIRWGSVAAAIGIIMVMVFLSYEPPAETSEQSITKEIATENGQRMHLRLSDGSRVVLNAGSSMQVPETFSGKERRVALSGEAYFEVAPDPKKPFVVHAGQVVTRVLGTKFDVKAYSDNNPIQVVVVEGKVELRSMNAADKPGVQLTKLQKGILDGGKTTVTPIRDISSYVGWTEGNLVFEDHSIQEVAARLERWYSINIQIPKQDLRGIEFTGSFTAEQPLDEVLDAITLSLDITYSREDSTVIFKHKQ